MSSSLPFLPGLRLWPLLAAGLLASCTTSPKEGDSSKPIRAMSVLEQRHAAADAAAAAVLNAAAPVGCALPVYQLAKLIRRCA